MLISLALTTGFLKQSVRIGKRLLIYDCCYGEASLCCKKSHYWETSKGYPGAAGVFVYLVSSVNAAGTGNCWDSG